ncbi:MAG: hypothetical protein AAF488_03885, partial [Planctomycetota bacterium]
FAGIRVQVNGESIAFADRRGRVELDVPGPVAVVVSMDGDPPTSGIFPPTVHAQLRYLSESRFDEARPSVDGTVIEREIEYWSKADDADSSWLSVQDDDELPVGTLLRVRCVVRGDKGHEYTLTESPRIGGWTVVPEPGESELFVNVRADRVLFDHTTFGGRAVDDYYARVTVPGRYWLPPARWFAMYDPQYEATTPWRVITIVDRE